MIKDPKENPNNPQEISSLHGKLAGHFDELSKLHAKRAENYGYSRDLHLNYEKVFLTVPDHPALEAEKVSLSKFEQFVEAKKTIIEKQMIDLSQSDLVATTSVTSTTAFMFYDKNQYPFDVSRLKLPTLPPWYTPANIERYADKLNKMQKGLGELLKSVWEDLHTKVNEAERTAISSMRTLFDQFLWLIGPEDKVLNSAIMKEKQERKENVDRIDRLKYGICEGVKDIVKRDYLLFQINPLMKSYKNLQRLHQPGQIDRDIARDAIIAIATFIFEYIDAVLGKSF